MFEDNPIHINKLQVTFYHVDSVISHCGLDGIRLDGDRRVHHHHAGHPAGLARGGHPVGHPAYDQAGHHALVRRGHPGGHLCMLVDDFHVFYHVDYYNIFGYFDMKIHLH